MKRICPTINELLAFEASARHLSFTEAASELCVTPSAISRQVTSLESFFDASLFRRSGKRLVLTEVGRAYMSKVSPGLKTIHAASLDLLATKQGEHALTLSSVPTFTSNWLIPRWPDFQQIYPQAKISFSSHVSNDESFPTDVDAAIRYGSGTWPNVVSDYLIGNKFVVICSPQLMVGKRMLKSVEDFQHHTLLQHAEAPDAWTVWCEHVRVDSSKAIAGPRFEQYSALISAVGAGLGIGLVPECLVGHELQRKLVINPFPFGVEMNKGHYLCYPKEQRNQPLFQAFRHWILETCASGRELAAPAMQ
jgi:LysR family transcriptional regulator, glycine cleavage system transcriptional activator